MNGVVFQISARQMASSADQRWPNQSNVDEPRPKCPSHPLTKPVSRAKAYFQANADTTVMIP